MTKIQRMFAEMGLGNSNDRGIAPEPPKPLPPVQKNQPPIFIRLSNSSAGPKPKKE